jgi:hypothetical protein
MSTAKRLKRRLWHGAVPHLLLRNSASPTEPASIATPALGLFAKRQRNVRAALERIIEKAGEVDVTASAVVSAIQAYTKINAAGQWVDRSEQVNLNDLFDRMSTRELEEYAQNGRLPGWFEVATAGATREDGQE